MQGQIQSQNSNKSCVPKGKPTTKITQGIGIGRIILQFVITNRCDLCQSVSISFMFLRSQEGVSLTHLFSAHGNSYLFWAWKRGQGSPDHFRKVAFALEPETVCEHGSHMVIWNHCNVKNKTYIQAKHSKCNRNPKKNTEHIPLKTFETYQSYPWRFAKNTWIRKCFGVVLAGQKRSTLRATNAWDITNVWTAKFHWVPDVEIATAVAPEAFPLKAVKLLSLLGLLGLLTALRWTRCWSAKSKRLYLGIHNASCWPWHCHSRTTLAMR